MPLFNEAYDAVQHHKQQHNLGYGYTLKDFFTRKIPVTSIEFNPPPVTRTEKQDLNYWQSLEKPEGEDQKTLKSLGIKLKNMAHCRQAGSFMSITDSAAGILRMHNLTMIRLLNDSSFTERWLDTPCMTWDPGRTMIHLTRNHSIRWLRSFLECCPNMGLNQLLLITGDPLKEMRLPTVTAQKALNLDPEREDQFRLKNSIELLRFIKGINSRFHLGVSYNPFMKRQVSQNHLLRKIEAGAEFMITQPVSYYDECWRVIDDFEEFCRANRIRIPIVLGVFNYSVPCGPDGYREEVFQKRYKFWKKLFGFVPEGVKRDYDLGLNGTEILARSINKLKRMGYYHFDVMNAERKGWSILKIGKRLTHELDRITGTFDLN